MSKYEIPSLYCPIEPAIHPHADQIEKRSTQWLDEIGLCRDNIERAWLLATRSAEFASRTVPGGDEDAVLLLALWHYLAFVLDDRHDGEVGPVSTADVVDLDSRVVRALEIPGRRAYLGIDHLDAALADLVERTRALCTGVQLHRFAAGLRDWLAGGAWMSAQIERHVMPTVEEYAAMRVLDNGTRFSLAWVEIAHRLEVRADQWTTPAVQALVDMSGFLVGVANDLIGYAKDDHLATPKVNMVNVIAHHERCPIAVAAARAAAMHERVMVRFLDLHTRICADAPATLLDFLDGITHYVRGVPDWMISAPRYASPRHRHELPHPHARLAVTFRETANVSTAPPRIASMQWWWQL